MRTGGGYTLHQSLTLESASIVKQAVSLARRRGHAQVTPLHVASAMLASSTNLLKRACLQSHSHPLQCKALELCFNVALNRLPTSASTIPLLGPHSHLPSLSNALVAAFKRAQAHQRRGSIENQQQPILALKVEIEQLVVSILDDPSVSRVMREAGFSSTQVKGNVEHVVSLEKCSSNQNSPAISGGQPRAIALQEKEKLATTLYAPTTSSSHQLRLSSLSKTPNNQANDIMTLLDAMKNNKTKNTVIVGECAATAESLVKGMIEKFDKKDEIIPSDMKHVQFISVPLFTLRNISREEFELRVGELRSLVKSYVNRGVVLYLGDLDWVSDFWSKYGEQRGYGYGYYCPVEYMIMEISRLICGSSGDTIINKRPLWLMGTATFQTYAKCKVGRPSLETLWCLHPLTIPVGSLALSLSLHSGMHDQVKKEEQETDDNYNWLIQKCGIKKQLICCSDCSINFNKEAQALISHNKQALITSSSSSLPSWLQQYKDEKTKQITDVDQECEKIKDLCRKWNSICSSIHRKPHFLESVFNLATPSPSSSTSTSSNCDHNDNKFLSNLSTVPKPDLLSNPNSSPNSASSSEATSQELLMELAPHKFNTLNSDNLNILINALENKVPWQKDIIHDIATTILECRSGSTNKGINREETWMFFLGVDGDRDGKEIIAREIAKTVFGSHDNFLSIGISNFSSSTKGDNDEEEEEVCNKRVRDEHGGSIYDRFLEGVRDNPSRVFYVHDFDQIDPFSLKGFERVIKNGSFIDEDGEIVLVKDAIVIFSLEGKSGKQEKEDEDLREDDHEEQCGLLDLNISTEDDDQMNTNSVSENGILDSVDKKIVFKIPSLVN